MAIQYTRPWLYPAQRTAIFAPARYSCIEASTKSGKTHGCIVWLFEQALQGKMGWQYWWVAPSRKQAKIAYRRLKLALRRSGHLFTYNDTEHTITLPVGTVISFLTGEKPDLLYGDDVHAAVIDEATRVREDAWHAIRSTLTATQGPLRVIGNVRGRKNWAYQMARKAEAGDPEMHYAKLTYVDAVAAGIVEQAEIDDAKRMLPEQVFNELYLAQPSDDGGNPFGLQHIAACVGPLSQAMPVVWGWDLAKYVDWTVGIALDKQGQVCRWERFQSSWEDTERRILQASGKTQCYIDSTGVGDPIFERLAKGRPGMRDYRFTSASKQQLMEGLQVAIQQHRVRFPDGPIRAELDSFEFQVTRSAVKYSAPDGMHDDCVVALALAVHGWAPSVQAGTGMPVSLERGSLWR
jgi:hypothetical protein